MFRTSERNSILHTFSHNSFVVGAFFFLRQLCCSPVLCFVSIKRRSSTARDSNAAKLTPIDPEMYSLDYGGVSIFADCFVASTHTHTCTHIDIHTHGCH